jgi:hypothetical protein
MVTINIEGGEKRRSLLTIKIQLWMMVKLEKAQLNPEKWGRLSWWGEGSERTSQCKIVVLNVASDATAWLGLPAARLKHLSQSKWRWVALSGFEPIEIAQSCGLIVLLIFMPQLCFLTVNQGV